MNHGATDFLARMAVPVAVFTTFALLRRYMPSRPSSRYPAAFPPAMERSFRRTQWGVGIVLILIGTALGIMLYLFLLKLNQHYADAEGPARFSLLPSRAIWWFLPLFGALTLSWELTLLLWSKFGDREFIARYLDWTNQKTGFDSTRALRWMAFLIVFPIGVATLLAVPMHTTLHENELRVRSFASMRSTVLPYSEVSRIFLIDGFRDRADGQLKPRPEIIVAFRNGRHWRSGDNRDYGKKMNSFYAALDAQIVLFLQNRTGLTLDHADTEADILPIPAAEVNVRSPK